MLHTGNVRFWIFILTVLLLTGLFFKSSKEIVPVHAAALAQSADPSLVPMQNIKQVAIGNSHTCAVTIAGAVKCWGNNVYGQLGNGSRVNSLTPVDVTGLSEGVIAVSTGYFHTCALTSGGSVKCWGNNSVSDSTTPIDVTGLGSGVIAISAGSSHTCALTNNGGVKCWGMNGYGQLGNGSKLNSAIPVDVSGLSSGVTSISAGDGHTCAVTNAGSAKCWGYNYRGRLGNGDTLDSSVPVDVIGLSSGVDSISAGSSHTCALLSNHSIKCWGENTNGELGNGSTTDSPTPVDVATINDGTTVISAGNGYTCAVLNNGSKCWGRNSFGELGNGETADSSTPVDVVGLSEGVESVSAGLVDTCALLNSKTIKCWGRNESGQLGNNSNVHSSVPVNVISLSSEISTTQAGGNHACLLTVVGDVKCWGWNFAGQLGTGNINNYHTPADVVSLGSSINSISLGNEHTCALTTAGGVKCWGYNGFGALGNSTTANSNIPVDVVGLDSGVSAVSAGGKHTCALTTTGGVKCWGWNTSGQVGNGNTFDSKVPVDVVGLDTGVAAISTGSLHTCALTTTSGVKCWGNNEYGELGNGTTTNSNMPVDVTGLDSGVAAISAGGNFTCALTTNGSVKCWGWNEVGQLGNGGIANSNIPVDVTGLSSTAIAISAGGTHTCVLTTRGGVKCWGGNYHGKLGNGSILDSRAPVNVVGLDSGVSVVSAGYAHTCVVMSTSAVKCWGDNTFGQLGDGLAWTTTPGDVVLHCYSLTLTHFGQGSDPVVAPDQSEVCSVGNYTSGTVVDFSAIPSVGWQVASWSGTSQDASTGLTNTLIMPASNYTVSVVYSQIITATDTPTLTSTPTETSTDTPTLTPTPTETSTPTLTPCQCHVIKY